MPLLLPQLGGATCLVAGVSVRRHQTRRPTPVVDVCPPIAMRRLSGGIVCMLDGLSPACAVSSAALGAVTFCDTSMSSCVFSCGAQVTMAAAMTPAQLVDAFMNVWLTKFQASRAELGALYVRTAAAAHARWRQPG